MILPDGFGIGSDDGQFSSPEGRRRRALTAIPGCPQGSRVWREKLVQVLASLGFKPFLPDEPCLFKDSGSDPIYLLTWVDDFVSSSPATPDGKKREDALKKGLRRCFPHGLKISPPGSKVYHILGCVLERPSLDVIYFHQRPYIEQLLRRAGCQDGPGCPNQVPVSPSVRLTKGDCCERTADDRDHAWYRSVVMSLNHAQNWTRPDLAYLTSKAAKFMQAPGEPHMRMLRRGLCYLRGKTNLGLVYDFRTSPSRPGLCGFFYASHADYIDTRRSTIAYVFFFSGCAISWKSNLHTFVTTSTNHSELVAAAMAGREAKFLWKLSVR